MLSDDGRDSKVSAEHLKRQAYLYVRQSTLRQVFENTESTKRQYELRQRAVALGWGEDRIVVIDTDLGQSGASAVDREGFQRLVSEVSLGRAGVVMGLEVSRLARNSSDWHRLLEICALRGTLILDEDGLYDPIDFNDRLLLGLKGTMSEAELHMLRARLRGGMLHKARRGELRLRLPTGFVYDAQGRVILDPDRQVQDSVRLLFATFRRLGSAHMTVKAYREQGLSFPLRPYEGPRKGELVWRPLTNSRVGNVLHNPRYAGAYAYGRRTRRLGSSDGHEVRMHTESRPREQWHTLILDAHPGYLSWAEYEENLARLRQNVRGTPERRRCPAREGPALLQGLVLCGVCGGRMSVRYQGGKEKPIPYYVCKGAGNTQAWPSCQSIRGVEIDRAVGELLIEAMTPVALDVALSVQTELEARINEADALRFKQVERARYEVDLARQRFMQVDPNHRLVADSLEADWNEKLRELRRVREDYEHRREEDRLVLDEESRRHIRSLATDFPRLWRDSKTSARDRKRMARLLIEDVTLVKGQQLMVHVRFNGGASRSLALPKPVSAAETRRLDPGVVSEIDRLLGHHTDGEVAEILNERGRISGTGKPFDGRRIRGIRRAYKLVSHAQRLRTEGYLTLDEVAARLGLHKETVKRHRRQARLPFRCHRADDNNRFLYEDPDARQTTDEAQSAARSHEVQYA